MKDRLEKMDPGAVLWRHEEQGKKLCGEQVLEISLRWPELSGKRMQGANRYYCRLRDGWKRQWEREVYLRACVDLAEKRAQSRPFIPWKASLQGRIVLEDEELLSIAMEAQEVHGDSRTLVCKWGDTWRVKDGMPVELKELFPKSRQWKKQIRHDITAALEECPQRGIYLDGLTPKTWKQCLLSGRFAVSEEQILLFVPQCTIAPAVEGVVELSIPRQKA